MLVVRTEALRWGRMKFLALPPILIIIQILVLAVPPHATRWMNPLRK
jgi:hypothetical protein